MATTHGERVSGEASPFRYAWGQLVTSVWQRRGLSPLNQATKRDGWTVGYFEIPPFFLLHVSFPGGNFPAYHDAHAMAF